MRNYKKAGIAFLVIILLGIIYIIINAPVSKADSGWDNSYSDSGGGSSFSSSDWSSSHDWSSSRSRSRSTDDYSSGSSSNMSVEEIIFLLMFVILLIIAIKGSRNSIPRKKLDYESDEIKMPLSDEELMKYNIDVENLVMNYFRHL